MLYLAHPTAPAIILFNILLAPSLSWALNLSSEVELLTGYDNNVNRKEDASRTESGFLCITPAVSINEQASSDVTLEGGYELTYTRYLADDFESQIRHNSWGDVTTRLRPRLFLNLAGKIEALENKESPDDEGWGLSLSPGLIYHFSDRMSGRFNGIYSRWRYDSLDFDTGRSIIRLSEHQVDNHYEANLGLTYLLTLSTYLNLAYRVDYNDSNNTMDEYNANSILTSLNVATGNKVKLTLGYNFENWNYYNWRAEEMLTGKLRDDTRHRLQLSLEYLSTDFLDLFFNFDMTLNHSNLPYKSFDRHLVYGGLRLNW